MEFSKAHLIYHCREPQISIRFLTQVFDAEILSVENSQISVAGLILEFQSLRENEAQKSSSIVLSLEVQSLESFELWKKKIELGLFRFLGAGTHSDRVEEREGEEGVHELRVQGPEGLVCRVFLPKEHLNFSEASNANDSQGQVQVFHPSL